MRERVQVDSHPRKLPIGIAPSSGEGGYCRLQTSSASVGCYWIRLSSSASVA